MPRSRGQTAFGQAATGTADADGVKHFSYYSNDDFVYYFTTSTGQSREVLVQVKPVILGGDYATFPRYSQATSSGYGLPDSTITIHYRRATDPAGQYPIVRSVQSDASGHWTRTITMDQDYRFYATDNRNYMSNTVLWQFTA